MKTKSKTVIFSKPHKVNKVNKRCQGYKLLSDNSLQETITAQDNTFVLCELANQLGATVKLVNLGEPWGIKPMLTQVGKLAANLDYFLRYYVNSQPPLVAVADCPCKSGDKISCRLEIETRSAKSVLYAP